MRLAAVVLLAACGRVSFDPRNDAGGDAAVNIDTLDAPAANAVLQISAGSFSTCALLGNGDVWCWGRGEAGELGDGSIQSRVAPGKTLLAVPATQINTNDAGTCAVSADGTMRCWGWNNRGQLGLGFAGFVTAPVQVQDTDVALVGLGNAFGCIRRRSGQLACAGDGPQLGEAQDRLTFGDMPGVDDAFAISAGDDFACALRADRSVWCWGSNIDGAFGDNTQSSSPVPTPGPTGPYSAISAGDQHVCAIRTGGTVECWGRSNNGELGNGSFGMSLVPVQVSGLTDVVQLASASSATCALHSTGLVDCWGISGVLGDGSVSDRAMPGPVPLDNVVEIASQTGVHVCARRSDNSVWCWGANAAGELGSGAIGTPALTPAQVVGLP